MYLKKISENQKRKFVDYAVKEAKKSTVTMKHGCVIVKRNKIVARGYNKYTNINFKDYFSLHAEIDALNKCLPCKNLILYVIRINSIGEIKMSKPCSICEKIIKKKGIKTVYYS